MTETVFSHDGDSPIILDAGNQAAISLPEGFDLTDASFTRRNTDLVVRALDGVVIVIRGYFDKHNPPSLIENGDLEVDGSVISALAHEPLSEEALSTEETAFETAAGPDEPPQNDETPPQIHVVRNTPPETIDVPSQEPVYVTSWNRPETTNYPVNESEDLLTATYSEAVIQTTDLETEMFTPDEEPMETEPESQQPIPLFEQYDPPDPLTENTEEEDLTLPSILPDTPLVPDQEEALEDQETVPDEEEETPETPDIPPASENTRPNEEVIPLPETSDDPPLYFDDDDEEDPSDTYVFQAGFGKTTIEDFEHGDALLFEGFNLEDIDLVSRGNKVVVNIIGQKHDRVTLKHPEDVNSDSYSISLTGDNAIRVTLDEE